MVVHSKSKIFISEYIALKNPEQTMFLFCELTCRFDHCISHHTRKDILTILVPWFYNLELVDINVSAHELNNNLKTSPSPTKSHATAKGTQLILNNLFYLTCKFGDQYPDELELLWAILASTWRSNLRIICRYLMIIISLATFEMLANGKRIICYLAKVSQDRCIDELISELERVNEPFGALVDRDESHLPFYRYYQIQFSFFFQFFSLVILDRTFIKEQNYINFKMKLFY